MKDNLTFLAALVSLTGLAGLVGLTLMSPPLKAGQDTLSSLFPLSIEEQRALAADAAAEADRDAAQWQEMDLGPVAPTTRPDLAANPPQQLTGIRQD